MEENLSFIEHAISLSTENVKNNGGPFGAIIVKEGKIVGEGVNRVTSSNDPTAHAEIIAIRNACANLNTFDLSGCKIYSSCEPCPMCLSAIYWSKLDCIYFANDKTDAANAGFRDDFIYEEITKPLALRNVPTLKIDTKTAITAFEIWIQKKDKVNY